MHIVLTGATGFLGRMLVDSLLADEHALTIVTHRTAEHLAGDLVTSMWPRRARIAPWSTDESPREWARLVDGADAIVNLAGEPIAAKRWTDAQKTRIYESRIVLTRGIVKGIRAAPRPPRLLVSASAVGYYGSRGDDVLTEASAPGTDFLAHVCSDWEAAASQAASPATQVALLRTGLVLSTSGGALPRMLTPFKLGLGGPLGSGAQYMSWIHHKDWLELTKGVITYGLEGAFNLTAPNPVTNAMFASALGRALGRPALVPTPAVALRLALGEMADALLLSGQRAVPRRALEQGYQFAYRDITSALAALFAPA